MLMRSDAFRELDRMTQQLFGVDGTSARPAYMPMDAWREGDALKVMLDLPGVDVDSIDLDVERNVVTVRAERSGPPQDVQVVSAERPQGIFSRQLVLGENLDTSRIEAGYDAGVLVLKIPVAEEAKPRKIEIAKGSGERRALSV